MSTLHVFGILQLYFHNPNIQHIQHMITLNLQEMDDHTCKTNTDRILETGPHKNIYHRNQYNIGKL